MAKIDPQEIRIYVRALLREAHPRPSGAQVLADLVDALKMRHIFDHWMVKQFGHSCYRELDPAQMRQACQHLLTFEDSLQAPDQGRVYPLRRRRPTP